MGTHKAKEEITHNNNRKKLHTFYASVHSGHVLTIASKCGIFALHVQNTFFLYHNPDLKMGEPNSFPRRLLIHNSIQES